MAVGSRTAALLVVAACTLATGGAAAAPIDEGMKRRSITVIGIGRERGAPDTVELTFAVEHTAPTAKAASQAAATAANRVIEALRKEVGANGRVETAGFSVNPVYRPPPQGPTSEQAPRIPEIIAYTAANEIFVKDHEVTSAGTLIDAAIAAGATRIGGLSFTIENPAALQARALKAAGIDAAMQAAAIGEALNLKLGAILEAATDWVAKPVVQRYGMAMRAEAALPQTPIEAAEVTTEARLRVVYAIE